MQAKSVMYAAVGAPVVAARRVSDQVSALKGKLDQETIGYTKKAEAKINLWAAEGEKVINKISEGKVVEEISSKVDLDQAKEQVTKLRDQLEDMLATWRTSFRPEDTTFKAESAAKAPAEKPAVKKPAAKKPAAKKPAAKKPAAKTTKSSSAAKTSSTKTATASAAQTF